MPWFNTWAHLERLWYLSDITTKSSDISWIGSIPTLHGSWVIGVFAGPVHNRGYQPTLLVIGSIGVVFGTHDAESLHENTGKCCLRAHLAWASASDIFFVPSVSVPSNILQLQNRPGGSRSGIVGLRDRCGIHLPKLVLYRLIDRIGFRLVRPGHGLHGARQPFSSRFPS